MQLLVSIIESRLIRMRLARKKTWVLAMASMHAHLSMHILAKGKPSMIVRISRADTAWVVKVKTRASPVSLKVAFTMLMIDVVVSTSSLSANDISVTVILKAEGGILAIILSRVK